MICLVLFLAVASSSAMAGYAGSSSGSNKAGNGYGYGYAGSFSSDGGAGGSLPPFPQFDFNNFLQSYYQNLGRYQEQIAAHTLSYSVARTDPRSKSEAQTSLTFQNDGVQQGFGYGFPGGFPAYAGFSGQGFPNQGYDGVSASAALGPQGVYQTAGVYPENSNGFDLTPQGGGGAYYGPGQGGASNSAGIGPQGVHQTAGVYPQNTNYPNTNDRVGSTPLVGGGNFGPGQGGALATAAIGPQGIHQTAGVFPENPNSPNIDNRFGATPQQGSGGFYGISTSSQSSSSNIDGKPTSFHQASTTVNDNGKVTTFSVKRP